MATAEQQSNWQASDGADVIAEVMDNDELEFVRRIRREPEYHPVACVDPVHEAFDGHQLKLLGPFLGLTDPPNVRELAAIVAVHPFRLARPGQGCFREMLEALARFCFLKGKEWDFVSIKISRWTESVT